MLQLVLKSLNQLQPFTNTTARVQVSFELLGILPDVVEIYAANAAGTGPSNLVDTVDINPPEIDYDDIITLQAGTYYTIYACPRTKTNGHVDDQIDGVYWEDYCKSGTIITKASTPSGGKQSPPVIQNLTPQPASINHDNHIHVEWGSSSPVFKIQIAWTEDGRDLPQHEDDFSDPGPSSGSWDAPTAPGFQYTFAANGGSGVGGDTWSGWGPTVHITASPNYTSLKEFLNFSGLNPIGQHLKTLVPHGVTLRKFMKL